MKNRMIYLSESKKLEEVKAFVILCFMCLEEYDYKEIANFTGLCLSTIYRLGEGKATSYCRFRTIQALGLAAGLRFNWVEGGATLTRKVRAA